MCLPSARTRPGLCRAGRTRSPVPAAGRRRLHRSIVKVERDRLQSGFHTIPRFRRLVPPVGRELLLARERNSKSINLFTWKLILKNQKGRREAISSRLPKRNADPVERRGRMSFARKAKAHGQNREHSMESNPDQCLRQRQQQRQGISNLKKKTISQGNRTAL